MRSLTTYVRTAVNLCVITVAPHSHSQHLLTEPLLCANDIQMCHSFSLAATSLLIHGKTVELSAAVGVGVNVEE